LQLVPTIASVNGSFINILSCLETFICEAFYLAIDFIDAEEPDVIISYCHHDVLLLDFEELQILDIFFNKVASDLFFTRNYFSGGLVEQDLMDISSYNQGVVVSELNIEIFVRLLIFPIDYILGTIMYNFRYIIVVGLFSNAYQKHHVQLFIDPEFDSFFGLDTAIFGDYF